MFRTIERYEETGLGLPYPVVLLDGAQEEINHAGERVGVHVPDMEGLVACIALMRALHPQALDGREVRFIRRVLGRSAKDFAEALVLDAATLSRWENNKQAVGGWADKQVRLAAVAVLKDRVPGLSLDTKAVFGLRIQQAPEGHWPQLEVRRVHHADAMHRHGAQDWDAALPLAA